MKPCQECGSEISGDEVFCPFCGIRQDSAAPVESVEPASADDAPTEPDVAIPPDAVPDEELESTMMMAPEELARLSAEAAGKDPAQPEEPAAADEVPVPSLISELLHTSSGDVKGTAEYSAGEIEPEIQAVAIESEGEPENQTSEATDEEPQAPEPDLQTAVEAREPEAADTGDIPEVPEGAVISMPDEELPEHDPFKGGAMFDSVRIMEHEIPDIQGNIDTMLGTPLTPIYEPGAVPVKDPSSRDLGAQSEAPSQTAAGIGDTSTTDGKRAAKLKPLSEGTILNSRYEVIRKIGGGGMGAVYLASDNNLGGVLRAVKEMIQTHIEDEQQEKAINDFRRESMILSTLDHPAIPTIFDYFYDESESRFYLVMKYISGGDLSSRLRAAPEGKIDEVTVTQWGIQIADVLDYLHSQPTTIVYRDLKPSNIMVDGNSGRVMLIDFGIARSISQKEEKGVTAVGTMGYAPPELFSGNVEPRSDIYSLGSTMFHLLTGADPQSNPLLIFDFQKNPRPRQINPRLSDQIEQILMRSVEYSAEARFGSAAEMRAVLEEHLAKLKSGHVTYGVSEAPAAVSLADQTVFCGFCGQRIVATDLFCAFCGAKQPIAQPGVHSGVYPRSAPTAKLFVEGTSELSAPTFSLQKDEVLLGRRDPMSNIFPEVDLSKYDPQTKISRRHARIWRDGNNFLLEDLGSSNGTVLVPSLRDAFRLVPHRPHPLTSGDKIKIGDTVLHFLVN